MKLLTVLAAAAMAASFVPFSAQAQGIPKTVPAEFPPSSYTGRQYVDSKGCVFIRAGVDGAVNWIPRMTRGREQICGLQPTLSPGARAVATAPRATAPAPAPAAATAPRVVRAPAAAPRYVSAKPPAPKHTAPAATYRTAPKPAAAPAMPAAPRVASTPKPVQQAGYCDRGNAVSNRYINSSSRHAIRCGPQTQPHVTHKVGGAQYRTAAPTGLIPPNAPASAFKPDTVYRKYEHNGTVYYQSAEVRVAPRHVYENQLAAREGLRTPAGYEPIWEDDRLNPYRAHQTFAGKAQMERIWTRHLPRELRGRDAGPTVTADTVHAYARPSYNSPYVGYASNSAAGGVSRAAQGPVATEAPEARATQRASHRYVQLGAFTDPTHARETAQKIANSGYPARLGTHTRNGETYTLVLTGPYKTQGALDRGMAFVRGMGFTQATLRR